jgi:hypothetical protein
MVKMKLFFKTNYAILVQYVNLHIIKWKKIGLGIGLIKIYEAIYFIFFLKVRIKKFKFTIKKYFNNKNKKLKF